MDFEHGVTDRHPEKAAVNQALALRARRRVLQTDFRCQMYNAFNHTQFSGMDTGARFDAAGNQVNGRFGEFTAARDPRIIQFSLRFYF